MDEVTSQQAQVVPNPAFAPRRRSPANRLLSLFTKINPGEATGALLMATNVFTLLALYYVLKTVREALILTQGGAEVKSYSSAGQALLLLLIVPAYGALASRLPRIKLISWVTVFFALNLFIFAALGLGGAQVGVPFFLWIGIFNLLIVAQFWALANDSYTEEQGKRLFPVIGAGSSLGAIFGAQIAKGMFTRFGPYWLMAIAAAALLLSLVLTWLANRRLGVALASRSKGQNGSPVKGAGVSGLPADVSERSAAAREVSRDEPLAKEGGFKLIFSSRYLLLIALLVLILNVVNSTGEYILSKFVLQQAAQLGLAGEAEENFIGGFYGDFFWWVNVLSFLFQAFLVWRLFKWIGVRGTLFVLPLIALLGYGTLLFIPLLPLVRGIKILENSTDYSIQNTTKQALFLPTSREAKYKAKAAIDTFFWRAGDVTQAGVVLLGTTLGFGLAGFARVNLVLALVWLAVTALLYREHRRMTAER
jgi:ATP:ADP antiporter, AAA family